MHLSLCKRSEKIDPRDGGRTNTFRSSPSSACCLDIWRARVRKCTVQKKPWGVEATASCSTEVERSNRQRDERWAVSYGRDQSAPLLNCGLCQEDRGTSSRGQGSRRVEMCAYEIMRCPCCNTAHQVPYNMYARRITIGKASPRLSQGFSPIEEIPPMLRQRQVTCNSHEFPLEIYVRCEMRCRRHLENIASHDSLRVGVPLKSVSSSALSPCSASTEQAEPPLVAEDPRIRPSQQD